MPPLPGTILKARCKSDLVLGLYEWTPARAQVGERFLLIEAPDSTRDKWWTLSSDHGIMRWFNHWIHVDGWQNSWDVVSWGKG